MSYQRNNYKIKYAVIPVYNYFCNIQLDVRAYVVGKCYLCGETKRYTEQGTSETEYDVVFEWNPNNSTDNNVPIYKPTTKEVTNSTKVSKIFDTPAECQEYADLLNETLIKAAKLAGGQKAIEIKKETEIAKQHYKNEVTFLK